MGRTYDFTRFDSAGPVFQRHSCGCRRGSGSGSATSSVLAAGLQGVWVTGWWHTSGSGEPPMTSRTQSTHTSEVTCCARSRRLQVSFYRVGSGLKLNSRNKGCNDLYFFFLFSCLRRLRNFYTTTFAFIIATRFYPVHAFPI